MKTTQTTKILAIGTINPGFEQSQVFAVLPEEVRETVDLYLDGKIEQWYSLQGKQGVAFIINVTDPAVAHEMLEKLPLGKAHMMSFELIPIGPLNPLRFCRACSRNLEICRALLGRHARVLACQSVTVEFASGEPLAWTCPSIRTAAAADPDLPEGAQRQKRDHDLQLIELVNSGFHGSAAPSYYLVE